MFIVRPAVDIGFRFELKDPRIDVGKKPIMHRRGNEPTPIDFGEPVLFYHQQMVARLVNVLCLKALSFRCQFADCLARALNPLLILHL